MRKQRGDYWAMATRKKVSPLYRALTVDPGDHTAYAFWDNSYEPVHIGQFQLGAHDKRDNLELQLFYLDNQFEKVIHRWCPKYVYIESVEMWEGALHSMTSIRRGDLFKLAYLVGSYVCIAHKAGAIVKLLQAREWKGQMKNDVVARRIKRAIGLDMTESASLVHKVCAVGIGLSVVGKL